MKRHRKKFFKKSLLILILILLDYSIINFSYLFSKTLFQIFIDKNNIYQINNFATITRNTISYLVLIIAFWARDLYKLKPWNIWEEVSRILYSSLMAGIVISFIYIDNGVPKDIFIWWITLMLFVGIDIVARFLLRCYLNKKNIYNIKAIILGSGFQGEEFCEYAIENPFSLYKIDGFVYENKEIVNNKKEEVLNKEIFKKADIKILGDIEHIIKYIVKHAIDEVVIAVPKVDRKGLSDIIHKLEGKVRYIKFIPDMYGLMTFSTEIHDYEQVLTIAASQGLLSPIKKIQKRIFDLICSIIGIIFLIPVFIIVYILIKLEDGGKVIFKQKRIGENGKEIYIYKFRTMISNAEEVLEKLMKENPEIRREYEENKKLKNDPRITKIGKILRKTSIDELPQLINVLIGNMSIVGPRPYLFREKKDMGSKYKSIIKTKPGITGLWQASGRNEIGFYERTVLDQYYIRNWSIWLDIIIILKTIKAVLIKKGASYDTD